MNVFELMKQMLSLLNEIVYINVKPWKKFIKLLRFNFVSHIVFFFLQILSTPPTWCRQKKTRQIEPMVRNSIYKYV